MKKTILLLAIAAGALAVQPAFAHTPAGAGGPPPGVTLRAPAKTGHISAEASVHSNGVKAGDREFGRDRADEVHALKAENKAVKAEDKSADRAAKAQAKLAKAEDKAADRAAKAEDKIADRNGKPKPK